MSGMGAKSRLRCAIYTRKSSEEGLEQEFNSLDAQREACAAYVQSQMHEGWDLLPDIYDDGGYSGGTMDRPGLQQLLGDVRANKVDIIVVYKVDRLSRSLSDFAKMVDIMDAAKASFVSVTQAFNTTTSMGRLTLNMLLSFAQFEREVTGERIRDKIAASKKKGMWMGGTVPLGYDVVDRKLVINPAEAATVRMIMERYVALASVRELKRELDELGIVTKRTLLTSGAVRGGVPFGLGGLRTLLKNRIYVGYIRHGQNHYAGEHEAIIDASLFDQVQSVMAENALERRQGTHAADPSLLAGLMTDPLGRPMYACHCVKRGKRYRYYVTHPKHVASGDPKPWRIAAHPIERIIANEVAACLSDPAAVAEALGDATGDELEKAVHDAALDSNLLSSALTSAARPVMERRIGAIILDHDRASITIKVAPHSTICRNVRFATLRSGSDVRLQIVPERSPAESERDEALVALIVEAHDARAAMLASPSASLASVAQRQGIGFARFKQLIRLSYLAPDIVNAIFQGTQPIDLNINVLKAAKAIPVGWDEQRVAFGLN